MSDLVIEKGLSKVRTTVPNDRLTPGTEQAPIFKGSNKRMAAPKKTCLSQNPRLKALQDECNHRLSLLTRVDRVKYLWGVARKYTFSWCWVIPNYYKQKIDHILNTRKTTVAFLQRSWPAMLDR